MKQWIWILLAVFITIPGLALRASSTHIPELPGAAVYGVAIIGSAFLLSWSSEVAELDIPRTLALSVLAIVAVLPEYAIDVYLAWTAAYTPENISLATANMTGANRLLVGVGWSSLVLLFWITTRKRTLHLSPTVSPALVILVASTAYAFTIVAKGSIHIVDTLVLGLLFAVYTWTNFKGEIVHSELVGPSASIGRLPIRQRRLVVLCLFIFSSAVIVLVAEPFVENLKDSGKNLGLSEFLLIQWIAPLASESPEILLAGIFVLKGRGADGLGVLVSSKVNQWTLLVATLPVAYNISGGSIAGLPLDSRQMAEVFLTASQSLFAVVILLKMSISVRSATLLFVLFATQLIFPVQMVRLGFASLYLFLSIVMIVMNRDKMISMSDLFNGFRIRKG